MTSPRGFGALVGLNLLFLVLLLCLPGNGDWLMDRSAAGGDPTAEDLPDHLSLQWVREYRPLRPAWPDQPKMQVDAAYRPVVLGKTLLVASSRADGVTALDTETGAEKWRFYTNGPVRFAPAVWQGKAYFASDDGYLYCVDAAHGNLVWKFRGGPSEQKVLGNGRLISTWPARGAPVVADGTVYFAAGIWPFMGIFLHALDARTGEVVWTNDGDGAMYIKQPHQAEAFAGVAPQGALAVVGDKLLIPGRSVPACYNRRTGKLLYYRLADYGKTGGGSEVAAVGNLFINGGAAFDSRTGEHLGPVGEPYALTRDVLYSCVGSECRAYDLKSARIRVVASLDAKGKKITRAAWRIGSLGTVPVPPVEALLRAGSRLYAGTPNRVFAIDLPLKRRKGPPRWQAAVEGRPVHLAAGDERLFVTTREGRIYCFGATPAEPHPYALPKAPPVPADGWAEKAADVLATTGVREGYCLCWGVGSGRLITELARQSSLHIVALDPDADRVNAFRSELITAGLYGERIGLIVGDPQTLPLPPYLASLMVSEDLQAAGIDAGPAFIRKAFASLRPYGGVACLPVPEEQQPGFAALVADAGLANAKVTEAAGHKLLTREGALPGSANWTHEHADAANTRVSRDQLVKAPLGLLWFGGPAHDGILPRHGHGPQPQVVDGRLIIEGVDKLRAVDIYTGRLLWEARLPGVGKAFDTFPHQAGANAGGSNYVSTPDGIYVAYGPSCLRLDPATGKQLSAFGLPTLPGEKEPPKWDYLNVADEFLVGGANPRAEQAKGKPPNVASSKVLAVMDRPSGRLLWTVTARNGFRHNAACIGGGRLYAIDRPIPSALTRIKNRAEPPAPKARLLALDLRTGKTLWSTEEDVFGTWLSFSAPHGVLVEAGRVAKDTLLDEPKGMRAYRADGKVLWCQKAYVGPAMIHGDTILKDRSACDLLTGAPRLRPDPLTGQPVEWTWTRGYGCNTPAASENLLTFRSGAAGFCDLCGDGGTGNFGGFRSGCTNNLIVAGGLLNAPDYTRNCTCGYQNQGSLALVPMPDVEMWTYTGSQNVTGRVRRVGINFGAPGCRKAEDGTLWLDCPHVGGPSPALPVRLLPNTPECFRRHASQMEGDGIPWVAASGVKGVRSVTVTLAPGARDEKAYTVRLHFVEPEHLREGERVFDVALQGQDVLKEFDVVSEAGGSNRAVVREFHRVRVGSELTVTLVPAPAARVPVPLLCGIEVQAEGW
jgi:outer membrane protein assembly factor BamB